eukprot:g1435.t1
MGIDAAGKLANARVLIVGLSGLGVEIAKNILLAGCRSLTLHDETPSSWMDLSSNFYLTPDDVNSNRKRADAVHERLAELNPYCQVRVMKESPCSKRLHDEIRFHVVVSVDQRLSIVKNLSKWCRMDSHLTRFIVTGSHGVCGYIFNDFGSNFTVSDPTGRAPSEGVVVNLSSSISQEGKKCVVIETSDEMAHDLDSGDYVSFNGVPGLSKEIENENGKGKISFEVTVLTPTSFCILYPEFSDFSYTSGGTFYEVKRSKHFSFDTFENCLSLENIGNKIVNNNFFDFERPKKLHSLLLELWKFREENDGNFPTSVDTESIQSVAKRAQLLYNSTNESEIELFTKLTAVSSGQICPVTCLLGGIAAQEIIKASTGKYTPIQQWLHFDFESTLPSNFFSEMGSIDDVNNRKVPLCKAGNGRNGDGSNVQPTRHDGQIVVYGRRFQKKLGKMKAFIVGMGALGCEFLKNFAIMGIGESEENNVNDQGIVWTTDLDAIETSNLSRQFLFRPSDVGQMKSTTAKDRVCSMNPNMNVNAFTDRVGPETENKFNFDFWNKLDIVVNALDNIEARKYVDEKCVTFQLPLIDSGTLGLKGHSQTIVPNQSICFRSEKDQIQKGIPFCTIKFYPHAIEHVLEWARDKFQGEFVNGPLEANLFLRASSVPDYFVSLLSQPSRMREVVDSIGRFIDDQELPIFNTNMKGKETEISWQGCVQKARRLFQEYFSNDIKNVLHKHPRDEDNNGIPFWSGKKLCPSPIEFDENNSIHRLFLLSASKLYAKLYHIPQSENMNHSVSQICGEENSPILGEEALEAARLQEFSAWKASENFEDIPENDEEAEKMKSDKQKRMEENDGFCEIRNMCKQRLDSFSSSLNCKKLGSLNVEEFDKDDSANFHMDFIYACAYLRATNYTISTKNFTMMKARRIAGRIIPAMVTSTASATGFVMAEFIKLVSSSIENVSVDSKNALAKYRNTNFNLALNVFNHFEPVPCSSVVKIKLADTEQWTEFSLWDAIDLDTIINPTGQEIIDWFDTTYGLVILDVSGFGELLYADLGDEDSNEFFLMNKMDVLKRIKEAEQTKCLEEKAESSGWNYIELQITVEADEEKIAVLTSDNSINGGVEGDEEEISLPSVRVWLSGKPSFSFNK